MASMQGLNRIPLKALRAVEAVSRLGSLARAAEELRVSPGAVSQQVSAAEAALGFPLFDRAPRGMRRTPRAEEICALLTAGFSRLSQAVALAETARDEVLTVSVAPIFAARWLIWRLPRFQAAHPEVKVRLDASVGLVDPGSGDVDLCIRTGFGDWPDVEVERLFAQRMFPVCAPELAMRLSRPADLLEVPIIREAAPPTVFGWAEWLEPGEPLAAELPEGPIFSDPAMCLDAAISGSGVYLTIEAPALDALERGRLVDPFGRRRATGHHYWLVAAEGRRQSQPEKLFRNWLKQELAAAGLGDELAG